MSALAGNGVSVGGIAGVLLFTATLLGVALFHHFSLWVALGGFAVISVYKIAVTGFCGTGAGLAGFAGHLHHEWVTVANLFCLLTGFCHPGPAF